MSIYENLPIKTILKLCVVFYFRRADRDPSKEVWGPQGAPALDAKKLERFKNGFVNLALPLFAFSEPLAAKRQNFQGREWTLWDRFEINEDMTLKQLLDHFKNKYNLEVTSVTEGVRCFYSSFFKQPKKEEQMRLLISELESHVSGKPIESHVRALVLEMCCNDDQGEDIEVPYIRYQLPPN
jgi:ubiquitin-activating enzyme E1